MKQSAMMILVAFFLLPATAQASVDRAYRVENDEIFEMFSTGGASPLTNSVTSLIDLQSGATLKINPVSGQAAERVWCSVIVTNGPAVLQMDEADTELRIYNNFIVRAPGSLTIRGAALKTALFFDAQTTRKDSFAQFDFQDRLTWDAPNLTTKQLGGDGTTKMTLFFKPEGFSILAGSSYVYPLTGSNIYGSVTRIDYDDNFKLKARVLGTNTYTAAQTIHLGSNREVFLTPAVVPDFATTRKETWRYCDGQYDFNVSLDVAASYLHFQSPSNVTFAGSLSGCGQLKVSKYLSYASGPARATGDLSQFTGPVVLANASSSLVLNETLTRTNDVSLAQDSRFAVQPSGAASSNVRLGTVSAIAKGLAASGIVEARAGQTVTIEKVSGALRLESADPTASFEILALDTNAVLYAASDVAVTFASDVRFLMRPLGHDGYRVWLGVAADGSVAIPAALPKPLGTNAWYEAKDVQSVSGLSQGFALKTAAGSEPPCVIADPTTEMYVAAEAEATVNVVPADLADWRRTALLWVDPSIESTRLYHYPVKSGTSPQEEDTSANPSTVSGCPLIHGLHDVRVDAGYLYRLWNSRCFRFPTTDYGYEGSVTTVEPYVATDEAPTGRAYLSFGAVHVGGSDNPRRIAFVDYGKCSTPYEAYNATQTLNAKFVVMVYGSQLGGGYSLLARNYAYRRIAETNNATKAQLEAITKDTPILYENSENLSVWVNGESVNPTITGLSGGWDIVSFDLTNASGPLMGFGGDGPGPKELKYNNGGKYLGEMIFLSTAPNESTRRDIERYLAARWGLLSKYQGGQTPVVARLAGRGTVALTNDCAATLSGGFSGTLSLAAAASATLTGSAPATEAEISALTPLFWIDPSAEGVVTYTQKLAPRVYTIVQREASRRTIGTDSFLSSAAATSAGRAPFATESARALGPSRLWIDYNNYTSESMGNTLRIKRATDPATTESEPLDARSGFIVQDSFRGGGTPFLSTIDDSGVIKKRGTNYTDPIYASGTTALLKNGTNYLNAALTPYANGFTGGPEVFTFEATDLVSVRTFGYYGNSENDARTKAEYQGEILLFDTTLDSTVREKIEAYLMKKWLGWMPTGYVDYTDATLAGAGTLSVATATGAPKLDADFSGTLTVTKTATFSMTVTRGATAAEDAVAGAIMAHEATLALPAEATISISVADNRRLRPGRYTLLDVKSVGVTTFTLAGDILTRHPTATLAANDGLIELVIPSRGMAILFR